MSEENGESQTPEAAVLISIVAVDVDSVKDATRLKLEIEGDANVIMAFTELNVAYLQALYGDQFAMIGSDGEPVTLGPTKIDPLDAGDDPVAE